MRYQPIYDIAAICAKKNIEHAVICPGSRCAPLTLAFTRHPGITVKTFSDERSAGFIGLGMAQHAKKPVILLCTSGTAAYNFAPAIAEAYFSQTPLLVFTADRPSEWIAQHDGQTIYQKEIFGRHVKKSFDLPQDYTHADSVWEINRIINEAINLSQQEPKGPVHINAPFREPLYPGKEEKIVFSDDIRVLSEHTSSYNLSAEQKQKIHQTFSSFHHVLVVAGQQSEEGISDALELFRHKHQVPVVHDILSNLHGLDGTIKHTDLFLGQASDDLKQTLKPDLLITFGQSLISKNLKLFLRKYTPRAHWHIQTGGSVADTFQHMTDVFQASPTSFFHFLNSLDAQKSFENQKQSNYHKLWEVEERRTVRALGEFFPLEDLNELELVRSVMDQLPENSTLHLANSMSVRYANFIGMHAGKRNVRVYSNRGTSGIDGCTSTAVGNYLASGKPTFLITGDLAFFYDRNAFWHNYPLENLRILLLNNHGGLIFDVLDGPSSMPEAKEYFITRQSLNARKLCEEFNFEHLKIDSKKKVKNLLKDFFDFDGRTKIMEIETETSLNKIVFENLKQKIKKSYEL